MRIPLTPPALTAVAITALLVVGGYPAVVGPTRRELTRLQRELTAATAQSPPEVAPLNAISDAERASWRELETRVRSRFVAPDDQPRAVVEVLELARAAGLAVQAVELLGPSGGSVKPPAASPAFNLPPGFFVHPRAIRLAVRHRYGNLLDFLDRLRTASRYVAVESLDVTRVGDTLQTELRLVSVSWRPE